MARKSRPTRAEMEEAADLLRRVLAAVEAGELTASSGKGKALLRRLEGTLAGWETALGETDHTE